MKTIFVRALESQDKAASLRTAITDPVEALGSIRFDVDTESFALVPGAPFSYWVSEKIRRLFVDLPPLESSGTVARRTNGTTDDSRWIRAAWEVPFRSARDDWRWVPHVKGGSFSTYYSDAHLTIHWDRLRLTYPGYLGTVHRPDVRPASLQYFFRPGLTWPRRTNGLSFRVMPSGCIFGDKGPAIFSSNDAPETLLAICAVVNSAAYYSLVALQLARTELAQSFEAGLIQQTPVPALLGEELSYLARLARQAWSLKRRLDSGTENSHAFTLPPLLQAVGETVAARTTNWVESVRGIEAEVAAIQALIDARCFDLYGIHEEDRHTITQGFGAHPAEVGEAETGDDSNAETATELGENDDGGGNADAMSLAAGLVSWAVGVAFGRFDIRLAIGARVQVQEPDPFEPLPVCSPGMLSGDDGQPVAGQPAGYPIAFPGSGILVDDRGHAHDLATAVRSVFDEVFKPNADMWWNQVAALLDPKDYDLRQWLASSFFEYHLKRYSKSRRKAPIFWQFAVPSGQYSVWLYAHRLTRDSLFQVQNDVVIPKLAHEERQLISLVQAAGSNPSAKERTEIARQEAFVVELRTFVEEVKRVAPLWLPALDDGAVLTMAPLWRLVPQHRSWQTELKSKWDELASGKCCWSHVAMHLWPERVIGKCVTDRSLAIAHGLEDVFWTEADEGRWKARPVPKRSLGELVNERTSGAVKAALEGLTKASAPSRAKAKTRKSSS
jgi:hypothetical protein